MIGELQLILTVRDKGLGSEVGYTQLPKYTGALVKFLRWRRQGSIDPTHGMVEVEPWPTSEARNQRFLIDERIYSLPHIIRGAQQQRHRYNTGLSITTLIGTSSTRFMTKTLKQKERVLQTR